MAAIFIYPALNPPASLSRLPEISKPSPVPSQPPKTSPSPSLITATVTPTPSQPVDAQGYYLGQISPRVPYSGLKFLEIDIHNFLGLTAQLDENDYHYQESVLDGYTFLANQGEDFEFIALEDRSSNPASFIDTEFYGWGPTVTSGDTTIGTGIPATTRYFYVVKGTDFYGPDYSVPGVTPFDGSRYGRYTLKITQRK